MYKNQKYDYTGAIKIKDILPDYFLDDLPIDKKKHPRLTAQKDRRAKLRSVFFEFLKLVIDDCIENNNKFISPTREWFAIYIMEKSQHESNYLLGRLNEVYKEVNPIKSKGKIYEFIFFSPYMDFKKKYKPIRIGYTKYKELIKRVNEGQKYHMRES